MYRIKVFIKNGLKLSAVLALSLTVLSSFGDKILNPHETIRLTPISIEEKIKLENARIQANPDISVEIKTLVDQYTETLTECSVDYESLDSSAVINAFLVIRASEAALNNDLEEQTTYFRLMDEINNRLSEYELYCAQIKGDERVLLSVIHMQALNSSLVQVEEVATAEKWLSAKESLESSLRIDESFSNVEFVPLRRPLF